MLCWKSSSGVVFFQLAIRPHWLQLTHQFLRDKSIICDSFGNTHSKSGACSDQWGSVLCNTLTSIHITLSSLFLSLSSWICSSVNQRRSGSVWTMSFPSFSLKLIDSSLFGSIHVWLNLLLTNISNGIRRAARTRLTPFSSQIGFKDHIDAERY